MNLNEYDKLQIQLLPPNPSTMMENIRSIGYRLETAIADILDNSITAQARRIDLQFNWAAAEADSCIYMVDDGVGMSDAEIIQAMQLGSKNPLTPRKKKDLGRFGMGLKTASFSQCRKLTVLSKQKGGEINYWTWDLDYVQYSNTWAVVKEKPQDLYLKILKERTAGTLVLWEKIDRRRNLPSDSKQNPFEIAADVVSKHLEMIFHRYLESKELRIFTNGKLLTAWDPFFTQYDAQEWEFDALKHEAIEIPVRCYVLPHKSKFSDTDGAKYEDIEGRNDQQGFYIYRNRRLLVAGGWMGLFKREEKYKLARIQIDLSNDLDQEWQIDIRKSRAIYPAKLKRALIRCANTVREPAANVFRHRNALPIDVVGTGLAPKDQQALYCELWFLRMLRLEMCPKQATAQQLLESWVGSSKLRHDFNYQNWAVEIKSKANQDFKIEISSENQLDDEGLGFLGLCYYEVALNTNAPSSESLNDLVDTLANLFETAELVKIFKQKLQLVGYYDTHASLYVEQKYEIKHRYYYHIKADFPRLIRATVPLGAMEVKYTVALANCEHYRISEENCLKSLSF